jgi:NAD(P)-dependent dehydrogenase (short-subunit alcohol dehydrogenase family)
MPPVRGSRVVTVSSVGHRIRAEIDFDDLQSERSYGRMAAYGRSKLANLMFPYELQRRLAGTGETMAVAAHLGGSRTELACNLPRSLRPVGTALSSLLAQHRLWAVSEDLTGVTSPGLIAIMGRRRPGHR